MTIRLKKLTVAPEVRGGGKVYRVLEGKAPAGGVQRAADGGGFATRQEAEALKAQLERRRAQKETA